MENDNKLFQSLDTKHIHCRYTSITFLLYMYTDLFGKYAGSINIFLTGTDYGKILLKITFIHDYAYKFQAYQVVTSAVRIFHINVIKKHFS